MRLDPTALEAGIRLVVLDTIGSTNSEALRLARGGERGPIWIVARRQTEGRGRRGRTWISEPGNLYASLLLTDAAPPDRAPGLSFVAALAVRDAIGDLAPAGTGRPLLKWPNDVLIGERKVAGILIEGEGRVLAVGIGVNCRHHPPSTAQPATALAAAGIAASPEDLLACLSAAMRRRLVQWNGGEGFATIREQWLACAAGLGQPVCVSTPDGMQEGVFENVDPNGMMVLRLPDGRRETVAAGDVQPSARREPA